MMNKVARAEIADSRWSWLYKVGGAARNKDACHCRSTLAAWTRSWRSARRTHLDQVQAG